jgi:hypothetical protein
MATRAQFYERKYGGGYRTARKVVVCEQSLCLHKTQPGEQYFDTQQVTTWPNKKRICKTCAEQEVGDV